MTVFPCRMRAEKPSRDDTAWKPRLSFASAWIAAALASSLATALAANPAACVTAGTDCFAVGFVMFGMSTVVDFERNRREVSAEKIQSIRIALEIAGVMFTNGSEPGVKLRKKGKRK